MKILRKRKEDAGSFAIIQPIMCVGIIVVTKVQATKTTKKKATRRIQVKLLALQENSEQTMRNNSGRQGTNEGRGTDEGGYQDYRGETDGPTKSEGTAQAWKHRKWSTNGTQVQTEKKVGDAHNEKKSKVKHDTQG